MQETESKFMWRGGWDIKITQATKNMKIVIGRGRPEQKMMRCIAPSRFAWPDVKKESGGGKSIGPKPGGHVCMEKQRTNTLIEGAKNTFGTTVLFGGVRTCKAENSAMSGEKMSNGEVIKFFFVIRLKMSNGVMEVGVDVGIKSVESGGDVRFTA